MSKNILGAICGEFNDGIHAHKKQQYDPTRELDWTGPFVGVQMDLTTTPNVEYATIPLSFVTPTWNTRVTARIIQHEQVARFIRHLLSLIVPV